MWFKIIFVCNVIEILHLSFVENIFSTVMIKSVRKRNMWKCFFPYVITSLNFEKKGGGVVDKQFDLFSILKFDKYWYKISNYHNTLTKVKANIFMSQGQFRKYLVSVFWEVQCLLRSIMNNDYSIFYFYVYGHRKTMGTQYKTLSILNILCPINIHIIKQIKNIVKQQVFRDVYSSHT